MISICIPVYNFLVVDLVTDLVKQIEESELVYEILIIDDASTDSIIKKRNRGLQTTVGIGYEELQENIGRNEIRYLLARRASYEYLLFLDADSALCTGQFLGHYEKFLHQNLVVVGGRKYRKGARLGQLLHYKYGQQREENGFGTSDSAHLFFLTCNFLVHKAVFQALKFDPLPKGYGHEDTFIYLQIIKLGIKVEHIDNPVFHDQLVGDEQFLENQKQALFNLNFLFDHYGGQYDFNKIRLLATYNSLSSNRIGKLLLKTLSWSQGFLLSLLIKTKHLFFLDVWKLSLLTSLQDSPRE